MSEILARDLMGKTVVGTDGTIFGTLYTITLNHGSGTLCELVVDPHEQLSSRAMASKTDEGRLLVSVDRVRTVTDQIVIDRDG